MRHDIGRSLRLTGDEIVGEVEQTPNERLVSGLDLFEIRSCRICGAAHDEPALGALGDDDDVLRHLGFHETEHLGAVILATHRPSDAAACDRPTPQVDAGNVGGVHEDLVDGNRFGHLGDPARLQLERKRSRTRAIGVRPHRRVDETQEPAQDAILIERRNAVDVIADQNAYLGLGAFVAVRPETGFEEPNQAVRDLRVRGERVGDVPGGEGWSEEPPIAAVGAQDVDLLIPEARRDDQPVQGVRLDPTLEPFGEGRRDALAASSRVQTSPIGSQRPEVVDEHLLVSVDEPGRDLLEDAQTEVLEEGQHRGQVAFAIAAVDHDPGDTFLPGIVVVDPDEKALLAPEQTVDVVDVADGSTQRGGGTVRVGEPVGAGIHPAARLLFTDGLGKEASDAILPRPGEGEYVSLELVERHIRHKALHPHREVDPRIARLAQREAVIHRRTLEPFQEQVMEASAQVGIEATPRHNH